MADADRSHWVHALPLGDLSAAGRRVVRVEGRQIAVFLTAHGVHACNNRCPHEGYPLAEGAIQADAGGCVLTCNWHNWKFDLVSGETLVGGDRLRRYPVEIRGDDVWLDLAEPPAAARVARALANLADAADDHDYDRIARELVRLERAGGDPLDAVRAAIIRAADRFEFGMTHALAAAPDWLRVRRTRSGGDKALALVPLVEILGHLAWDSLREPAYPFPEAAAAHYDEAALVAAIEAEDEPAAAAQVRAALAGPGSRALDRPLSRAAAAHYADFGHSMIYVTKARELLDALGNAGEGETALAVYLALARSLVYATREDLIPEFRAYAPARAAWDGQGDGVPDPADFRRLGVGPALERAVACSGRPKALYDALLGAAAWQMLHFDERHAAAWDRPVQDNVGFLDFTHAVTFANAGRRQAERHPELWPDVLLQLACFTGRNAKYADPGIDSEAWRVDHPAAFLDGAFLKVLDHGQAEYIVSAHLLKVTRAVEEELADAVDPPWAGVLLAAANRFLNSPIKRRHIRRAARQAIGFVEAE